ncbi:hypothetical protein IWQ60_002979 [Tieghemiomyces parasiticus]|uniref:Uncharacterized protein n=1 Tax=Tieghemiomyces parasiticus TaxID=78921 RepID=A0A9W8AIM7_9FUNG|nr:hypothetical protein IWQ60_002979 [Tieghemiomyces parasiticus]
MTSPFRALRAYYWPGAALRLGGVRVVGIPTTSNRIGFATRRRLVSTAPSVPPAAPARGWRRYLHLFKNQPSSYIVSFAVLHEVTAIVPLLGLFWLLSWTDWGIDIDPERYREYLAKAEKIALSMGIGRPNPETVAPRDEVAAKAEETAAEVGWRPDSNTIVHLATAYGIIKLLAPARIAMCVFLTPTTAKYLVQPVIRLIRAVPGWFRRVG